jgi:uncharacterized protein YndB with AHSA1/START domain
MPLIVFREADPMQISSTIVVAHSIDQVWTFVADPSTAPQWDRSVAAVVVHTAGPVGVGSVVETTAPDGKRQTFQIMTVDPPRQLTFALLRSWIFKRATLTFLLSPTPTGTTIRHQLDLTFHWWAGLVAVLLRLTHQQALATDLALLHAALDRTFGDPLG